MKLITTLLTLAPQWLHPTRDNAQTIRPNEKLGGTRRIFLPGNRMLRRSQRLHVRKAVFRCLRSPEVATLLTRQSMRSLAVPLLYHQAVITATKLNREAQEIAYKEGFKDGAKYGGAEDAYRRGYIAAHNSGALPQKNECATGAPARYSHLPPDHRDCACRIWMRISPNHIRNKSDRLDSVGLAVRWTKARWQR